MERYRVPKHKMRVRIRTADGREENISLFLSDFAEDHVGSERPSDLFRAGAVFFVAEDESGKVVFVRGGNLSLVTIPLEDDIGDGLAGGNPVAGDLYTECAIRVVLEDGLELTGVTRYQLPEAQARLQDFLNSAEPFIPLYQGEEVVLINKSRVARVTPA